MTVVEIEIVHVPRDYEAVRRRLGDTGHIRRAMGDLLDESARVGEQSAQIYAPSRSRKLEREIESHPARRRPTGFMEAIVGVGSVRGDIPKDANADYPFMVHEGTGLFGKFHRLITPVRAPAMVFIGKTGLVIRKTIKGQRPQPFMAEAFEDVNQYIPQRVELMVDRILLTDL